MTATLAFSLLGLWFGPGLVLAILMFIGTKNTLSDYLAAIVFGPVIIMMFLDEWIKKIKF